MSERIDDPNFEDYSWTDHERELHNRSQEPTQLQTVQPPAPLEPGEVRQSIVDINTPEGRAENERRNQYARDRDYNDISKRLAKYEEDKRPKPLYTDKGDHYEINVSGNAADAIASTVSGLVGTGLVIAAGPSMGSSLGALPIAGSAGYLTKEGLSSPIKLNKTPNSVPTELDHLKEMP